MKSVRFLPLVMVLLLTGCPKSKIHQERTFSVDAGDSYQLQIDAPTGNQKIAVSVSSKESTVNVYIVLDDQITGNKDDVDPAKLPATAILGSEKSVKDAVVSASIPAKKAYRIIVTGATKKTNVTVKVDSV